MLTSEQIDLICAAFAANRTTDGILLCGSYAYGQPTEASDLDLRVITNDGQNFDGRGLRMFDTDIELLCNSPERVRAYFAEGVATQVPYAVHFWAHGKIMFDRTGIVAELQHEAQGLWKAHVGTWRHQAKWAGGTGRFFPDKA